jgi:pimeloyl-ACP methyl ester carboxylesterase
VSEPRVIASPTIEASSAPPMASDEASTLPLSVPPIALGTPPLRAEDPFAPLAVRAFRDAVVSLPRGATKPRPVVIASHGNYDRPEWQCSVWRGIVGDRAFVLCPRGVPRSDSPSPDDTRFTYDSDAALAREIDAGLDALGAGYGDYVDRGAILYTGFSLGAIFGVPYLKRDPSRTTRAVLIEGGHDAWTPDVAKRFKARGGERVLFACGLIGCVGESRSAAAHLERAGVATKIVYAKLGHAYDGPVADEVKGAFDWVTEGDPRWAP